jgi:hypothetical protein
MRDVNIFGEEMRILLYMAQWSQYRNMGLQTWINVWIFVGYTGG